MTHMALDIASKLTKEKINLGVIDLYTLPINESELLGIVKDLKKIITLEEHFLPGGLGSSVCEFLSDHSILIPVKRIGISTDKGYCYKYGGRELIRKYYGIDRDTIQNKIERFILI